MPPPCSLAVIATCSSPAATTLSPPPGSSPGRDPALCSCTVRWAKTHRPRIAVLLDAVGVNRAAILADYAATNDVLATALPELAEALVSPTASS
jgi:hypothetical protein